MLSVAIPAFLASPANAETQVAGPTTELYREGKWWKVQADPITILFPTSGKKPMFLWWHNNDTINVYVVKYKGLIEYLALEQPYYMRKWQADNLTIQERLEAKYAGQGPHMSQIRQRIRNHMLAKFLDFHPAYLPFSACQWNLTGPANVQREDGVSYVSFNFTLKKAPPKFAFAEDNVIIRCRFYKTDATENVRGLYNYTVNAGELKMDFVVQNWKWNIDRLSELFQDLNQNFDISLPQTRAGLALWTNMASIRIEDLPLAEQDASSASDALEGSSQTSDIVMGGQRVQVQENRTAMGDDETPIRERIRERYKLHFAKGSQTLAGFFDFVDKATIIDPSTGDVSLVNVTGAYIAAGRHMRVFISYPYFGAKTLEHDPTIGVESVVAWMPPYLLFVLVGATIVVAVAVAAIKLRKKTVNILSVQ
jgi:hypothetical protein